MATTCPLPADPAPAPATPARMRTREAASFLGLAPATLEIDRCRRRLGIPYLRLGRTVVYDRVALIGWLRERNPGAVVSEG